MPGKLRFLLDSGAFTAFKSGKPIKLDDYCRFLETLPIKPWRYFALDVIGDEDATFKNYETMLARGFGPIPVYTLGGDISIIEDYYKTTDCIAFGGLVGKPKNHIAAQVQRFQKAINGRKAHLLGYTPMNHIKKFKPYSCDSSSWEGGARFGGCDLYMGNGKMIKVEKKHFTSKPSDKILAACQRLGARIDLVKSSKGWKGGISFQRTLGGASWVHMSMDAEKHIGTKLFLAGATGQAMEILTDAYKFLTLDK